uniref:Uncharacterized protein n=1 Tax=Anguilla anguilla TaxID=7936 RepID=A0A0E9UD99_ANGAN
MITFYSNIVMTRELAMGSKVQYNLSLSDVGAMMIATMTNRPSL